MKVTIVCYDQRWAEGYLSECRLLEAALAIPAIRIHHIGSTSVPGLAAKPIIDILIEASSLAGLDRQAEALAAIGYEALGEYGIPGRRYFRKGGATRTHHVHAFAVGDPHIARHLAFRDYLRAHPAVADEYGRLKLAVAAECAGDMERYCDGKDAWIKRVEAIALQWASTRQR